MSNPKKILHIVDDSQFVDIAYRLFEAAAPNMNFFVMFSSSKATKIKYAPVKVFPHWRLTLHRFFPFLMPRFDSVVLHGLGVTQMRYLSCLKYRVRVCWIGLGYDYYNKIIGVQLLKKETEKKKMKVKKTLIKQIETAFDSVFYGKIDLSDLQKKIDLFSPVIYEDYLLVRKSISNFKPEYVPWNYGTLEDDLVRGFKDCQISGNNILLGNSATQTNNHIDAFEVLKSVNLGERKIIAPLSYGDDNYRKCIVQCGRDEFGESFVPLVDFVPIDDYVKIISSCSHVVMNHLRQQGLGNIVIMMYLGAKVFLDKKNPLFIHFKKMGAFIYSLDDYTCEFDTHLNFSQIEANRQILKKEWSRDALKTKTNYLVDRLSR